jgi:hypothetical protein
VHCYNDSDACWLGLKMIRNNINGKEYYASIQKDSIEINTWASLNDTLFVQKQGANDVFIALVDSIDGVFINGTLDSMKFGRLSHYKNSINYNNINLDKKPIVISKNYGWQRAPQLFMHTPLNRACSLTHKASILVDFNHLFTHFYANQILLQFNKYVLLPCI